MSTENKPLLPKSGCGLQLLSPTFTEFELSLPHLLGALPTIYKPTFLAPDLLEMALRGVSLTFARVTGQDVRYAKQC